MQRNILIIEDVKELSDLVTLYLTREGFEVRTVESAEEGFTVIDYHGWSINVTTDKDNGTSFVTTIEVGDLESQTRP